VPEYEMEEDPNDDPTEVSDLFARSRTLTREEKGE